MAEDFDLSNFITGSLCIRATTTPAVKPMVPPYKDPLSSWFEEDPLKVLGDVEFSEKKQIPEDTVGTPIQEFFRGVNVFITGGSGFLGKVLTEKLVRSMPHIGHVYLVIREKRGKCCKERFQVLLEDKVFSRMKAEVPYYHTKITALAGDISEPGLGLSDQDRQLVLGSVNVVFHCAADVRFLEPLRKAISSNVLGSKHVMDLAKQINHLKAYIHVSTAYSQCVNRVLEEKVPKTSINYKDILHYVETNTDSHIEDHLESILQGWPNTYAFTKGLCENMIEEEAEGLPLCIFRPSIVISTYKEPVRGYTDNLYGPLGVTFAVALGVLHWFRTTPSQSSDMVPVDYVINCMIAASWSIGKKRDNSCQLIYNFTSSPQNIVIWKRTGSYEQFVRAWPYNSAVWYPSLIFNGNYWLNELCHVFLHKIPAAVLDQIAILLGNKPRLSKTFCKIYSMKKSLHYFGSRFWEFKNDNVIELWNSLNKEDQQLFNFDVKDIDWTQCAGLCWLGLRYYYMKESMASIPAAKKKTKWLRLAHGGLKLVCGFVVLKLAVWVARVLPL